MRCLTEGHFDCGLPPYSVSSIHYMLYFWDEETGKVASISKARKKTQMNQIRRTLNELVVDGIVIMSRELQRDRGDVLPFWENQYQIAAMAEVNYLERELSEIERKISRAYNGFGTLFGGKPDGNGMTEHEKKELTKKIKSIMQRVHPDKVSGKEHQFITMKKCLDTLRAMKTKP